MTVNKKKDKPSWQRKHTHKGKACRRGLPVYYQEKEQSVNLSLTPAVVEKLKEIALENSLSRSEVVERIIRGTIISQNCSDFVDSILSDSISSLEDEKDF